MNPFRKTKEELLTSSQEQSGFRVQTFSISDPLRVGGTIGYDVEKAEFQNQPGRSLDTFIKDRLKPVQPLDVEGLFFEEHTENLVEQERQQAENEAFLDTFRNNQLYETKDSEASTVLKLLDGVNEYVKQNKLSKEIKEKLELEVIKADVFNLIGKGNLKPDVEQTLARRPIPTDDKKDDEDEGGDDGTGGEGAALGPREPRAPGGTPARGPREPPTLAEPEDGGVAETKEGDAPARAQGGDLEGGDLEAAVEAPRGLTLQQKQRIYNIYLNDDFKTQSDRNKNLLNLRNFTNEFGNNKERYQIRTQGEVIDKLKTTPKIQKYILRLVYYMIDIVGDNVISRDAFGRINDRTRTVDIPNFNDLNIEEKRIVASLILYVGETYNNEVVMPTQEDPGRR